MTRTKTCKLHPLKLLFATFRVVGGEGKNKGFIRLFFFSFEYKTLVANLSCRGEEAEPGTLCVLEGVDLYHSVMFNLPPLLCRLSPQDKEMSCACPYTARLNVLVRTFKY